MEVCSDNVNPKNDNFISSWSKFTTQTWLKVVTLSVKLVGNKMSFQKLYFCYKHYKKCPNTLQNRVPVVFTLRNRCLFDVKYNRYIATNHKHTFQTLHRNGMIYLYTIHTYSHTHTCTYNTRNGSVVSSCPTKGSRWFL